MYLRPFAVKMNLVQYAKFQHYQICVFAYRPLRNCQLYEVKTSIRLEKRISSYIIYNSQNQQFIQMSALYPMLFIFIMLYI